MSDNPFQSPLSMQPLAPALAPLWRRLLSTALATLALIASLTCVLTLLAFTWSAFSYPDRLDASTLREMFAVMAGSGIVTFVFGYASWRLRRVQRTDIAHTDAT